MKNKFIGLSFTICLAFILLGVKAQARDYTEEVSLTQTIDSRSDLMIAYSSQAKKGYEITLYNALSVSSDIDESNSTDDNNSFEYLQTDSSLYTTFLIDLDSTQYVTKNYNVTSTRSIAFLALYGDLVTAKVTCRQYQKWWFNNNQELLSEDKMVYIFTNLSVKVTTIGSE